MTSFYYYDKNPSGFCFLVLIRAFVIQTSAGITKFTYERKNEKDSGRSSKMTPSCKWPIELFYISMPVVRTDGGRDGRTVT